MHLGYSEAKVIYIFENETHIQGLILEDAQYPQLSASSMDAVDVKYLFRTGPKMMDLQLDPK